MKSPRLCLGISLSIAATAGVAQPLEKWGYPDPDLFGKAVHTVCEEQHLSVMLAARHRDQGHTRDEVLALVPPNSPALQLRAIDVYRENVEDVFMFPHIGTYAMMVFRAEACRREVMSARTLPRFGTVVGKIVACETQHGKEKSNALYACVRTVVNGM